MKICIATSSYPTNPGNGSAAAGLFVRDFAFQLYKLGHQIFVLTQARRGLIEDDPRLQVIRYKWCDEDRPLATLNPFNPKNILKIVILLRNGEKKLIELIQKEKIDFCLAMWAVPSGYLTYIAHKRLGTPYAVWTLGSDIWLYGKYPFLRSILKKILDNACRLFADGYELVKEVEKLSKNKCFFLASAKMLPNPELRIAIDKTKINFLFIGRFHKNKGIDILIESINLIPKDFLVMMNFYIFGGGDLANSIKAKIKTYGLEKYVFVDGFISSERAAGYLSSCDCLIIPSRIESIPVILSDSLQMGCPVIVTDVGDMGKLVKKYNAGKVVKPESPGELKDAIIEFVKENKNKYLPGINELKKVFDVESNAKRFLELTNLDLHSRSQPCCRF